MILYERVSYLAKKQGISVFELADKLHLSRNSVYSWKKSSPKAETLEKVADYFHTTTDYLLGRTDDPNPLETGDDNIPPEFFAIQRKSKQLNQKDQQRLLKIMEATFDDIDSGRFEEDEDDDL